MEIETENRKGYKKTKLGYIPEDWNIHTIENSLLIKNNARKPISEEVRKSMQGDFPYYGPTKIQDYINEYQYDGEYALIAEDGDHFLKYKDFPMTQLVYGKFNVNNHAHAIKGTDKCLTKWFYWFYNRRSIYSHITRQGAGRYKLNKSSLSKMKIAYPDIKEQKQIIEVLDTWENAIKKLSVLIAKKELQKSAIMQQLLYGKTRLEGFNEKWVELKAKNFFTSRNIKHVNNGEIPLFSLTIDKGVTEKTDRYEREFLVRDKNEKKYKVVYPNDIVYNPANLRWGAISIHKRSFSVLVSPIYEILFVKKGFDVDFISYLVSSSRQISFFASILEGTLQERMAVKLTPFLLCKYQIPSLKEQKAIANVLQKADQEIMLLNKKLDQIKAQKKGLMQQLLTGKKRLKF